MKSRATQKLHCNLRHKQMQFLLDKYTKPILNPTAKVISGDDKGYDPLMVTMTIINTDKLETNYQVGRFMQVCQIYLPDRLQSPLSDSIWAAYSINAAKCSPDTLELISKMKEWFGIMKDSVINSLTDKFFQSGHNKFLEVMKRRWKNLYSERTEEIIDADVKQETNVNITFEDA